MTTIAEPVFVDTIVLVFNRFSACTHHFDAVAKLSELHNTGSKIWVSRQILREYAATLTRPQRFLAQPVSIGDVIRDIRHFETSTTVAEDSAAITARWLDLLSQVPCGGKQVHDANLVATMLVNAIPNLLTHNTADFQRFSHMITIIPLVP
jgi:hypothetical protein